MEDSKGGSTLYVGSTRSDVFGRLYDKGQESGEPEYAGCWRYEVEYRRRFAEAKSKALMVAPQEATAVTGDIHRWFSSRGVRPCFAPGAGSLDSAPPLGVADDEGWLAWIRKCVQPRARRLRARRPWLEIAEAAVGSIEQVDELEGVISVLTSRLISLQEV